MSGSVGISADQARNAVIQAVDVRINTVAFPDDPGVGGAVFQQYLSGRRCVPGLHDRELGRRRNDADDFPFADVDLRRGDACGNA